MYTCTFRQLLVTDYSHKPRCS